MDNNLEIERKFLVNKDVALKEIEDKNIQGTPIAQGYLTKIKDGGPVTVRVRIKGDNGYITIKSNEVGISRTEFEYEIPLSQANEMLKLCEDKISKKRYVIPKGEHLWELDIFEDDNKGLILAEIELKKENEFFEKPKWIEAEVSDDLRYFNINLSTNPYSGWCNCSKKSPKLGK